MILKLKKMKKVVYGSLFVALVGIILLACKKENVTNNDSPSKPFDRFMVLGHLHNDFLENANKKFVSNDKIENGEDALSYVTSFNIEYVGNLTLNESDKIEFKEQLAKHKDVLVKERLIRPFYQSKLKSGELSMMEMIQDLYQNEQIISFDKSCLDYLVSIFMRSYEGSLSSEKVHELLLEQKDLWILSQENESKGTDITANIIAISICSLEWWEENPDAFGLEKVAPWVVADAVGAAYGAVDSATGQYLLNGDVSAGGVGWGAAAGAVNASTGLVGKVSGWISGWF